MGREKDVLDFIAADPSVVHRFVDGDMSDTPLVVAARHGRASIVRALLEHGAAVNDPTPGRTPPLTVAAESGSVECVQLLLDHGADLRADSYLGTALHRAAQFGRLDVIKHLVALGVDVGCSSGGGGQTPLHAVAWWSDASDVAEFLIARGATVDLRSSGQTPLHATALRGGVNVARVLLRHGADVNALDEHGRTTLSMAMRENVYAAEDEQIRAKRAELVDLLRANGAVEPPSAANSLR